MPRWGKNWTPVQSKRGEHEVAKAQRGTMDFFVSWCLCGTKNWRLCNRSMGTMKRRVAAPDALDAFLGVAVPATVPFPGITKRRVAAPDALDACLGVAAPATTPSPFKSPSAGSPLPALSKEEKKRNRPSLIILLLPLLLCLTLTRRLPYDCPIILRVYLKRKIF